MTGQDWANDDHPFRVRYRRMPNGAGNAKARRGASFVYCASEAEADEAAAELRRLKFWAVQVETKP